MAATPSTSSKRRKVDSECRGFNPVWREKYLFAERYGKAQCLICLSTVAVFKEFNIKRHWESNHANTSKYAAMDRAARLACASHLEESLDKQAASFSKKSALQTTNESVTRAGYEISRIIACHIKPFTDGEYIKECVLSAVDAVCPAERKKMAGLCLSARTVTRRTEHMAGNVRETLSQTCASLEFLSIALDESTDLKNTSQLAVFIRGVTASFTVVEEFLQLVPLRGRTTGKIVCDATLNCLASTGLDLVRLVSVTTDGAPAMVGRERGAASLLQKHCADAGNVQEIRKLHCIIHQEALCAKAATLTEVMGVVVKVVNSVLASSLNHRLFRAFLEEVDAHYGDLIYFCEVRWLSRGKMLERVFELRAELVVFLAERNLPSADLFADSKWLAKLALLTDVTEQLNDVNRRLQGRNIIVTDMFATISAFEVKLRLWEAQLSEHKPTHFKRLAACDSKDIDFGECASVITVLRGEFASRFEGLRACSSDFRLFTSPFDCVVDDVPDELQMEVVELQCNVELKSKFLASSPLAFFSDHLSERDFPHLVRNAKKIAAMFGSTYCCEQLFSKMKIVMSRYRAQLSDEHLNHILLLSSSSISPDISSLCSEKHQYHSSH